MQSVPLFTRSLTLSSVPIKCQTLGGVRAAQLPGASWPGPRPRPPLASPSGRTGLTLAGAGARPAARWKVWAQGPREVLVPALLGGVWASLLSVLKMILGYRRGKAKARSAIPPTYFIFLHHTQCYQVSYYLKTYFLPEFPTREYISREQETRLLRAAAPGVRSGTCVQRTLRERPLPGGHSVLAGVALPRRPSRHVSPGPPAHAAAQLPVRRGPGPGPAPSTRAAVSCAECFWILKSTTLQREDDRAPGSTVTFLTGPCQTARGPSARPTAQGPLCLSYPQLLTSGASAESLVQSTENSRPPGGHRVGPLLFDNCRGDLVSRRAGDPTGVPAQ